MAGQVRSSLAEALLKRANYEQAPEAVDEAGVAFAGALSAPH